MQNDRGTDKNDIYRIDTEWMKHGDPVVHQSNQERPRIKPHGGQDEKEKDKKEGGKKIWSVSICGT